MSSGATPRLKLHQPRCYPGQRVKIDQTPPRPGAYSIGPKNAIQRVRPLRVSAQEGQSRGGGATSDVLGVIKVDPLLADHEGHLQYRWERYQDTLNKICQYSKSLKDFATGYNHYGISREEGCTVYREWAPGAVAAQMIGDFNNWHGTWMERDQFGVWTCKIPDNMDGSSGVPHLSRVKIRLQHHDGWWTDVLPAWTKYAAPGDDGRAIDYDALHWDPPHHERHNWQHQRPNVYGSLRIYEAHVGMSSQEPRVASYWEFAEHIIPRIAKQGYNAIQLMAVQEHVYYASFGYHVTSPFAVSSRCGNPEELKKLIDAAHGHGLLVLLDVVHSHVSKNTVDGLAGFDMGQAEEMNYFYPGERGYHKLWDSRLPNYRNWEVLKYLLSNLSWWIEEYRFDGFRFDGVTSMLYHHHGIDYSFSGNYEEYFSTATDVDAVVYLMLANKLVHDLLPQAVTISEDVSGMPGMCRPVHEGGIGFDYRLGMGLPDKWFEIVDTTKDEDWSMQSIVDFLGNRRTTEKTVAYLESHDQCLVGGQTFAFKLIGPEMYTNMTALDSSSAVVERGFALHKIVRLVTMALGGDAWLNFMGNEFGHPDWLDFPREGNGWSHEKCRRQWGLVDSEHLKYRLLNEWDGAMMHFEEEHGFMRSPHRQTTLVSNEDQVIVAERGPLVFVFNFSPFSTYEGFKVPVSNPGRYRIVLDSDAHQFGGVGRLGADVDHFTSPQDGENFPHYMQVLSPSRTAVVYCPVPENH
ncbi:hypothetical protein BSKO_08081 [Bryopsis sp. KO-2023]|nr:hypothetical protein BSKO_08081 [Bryopsis sp. KO-2023]